jgi:hypothetical protein
MNFPENQTEPIRRWVCRVVHELIVQKYEPINIWNKPEVVQFT